MKTTRLDPSFVPIPFIIAAPLVTHIVWRVAQTKRPAEIFAKRGHPVALLAPCVPLKVTAEHLTSNL
jgi:hypothetical protein